ncbi:hypothetical protein NX059_012104 [Plenodomus lindquistii]|nr:hypothetical protein NX059_012104 [Plenodomus lindquistii]
MDAFESAVIDAVRDTKMAHFVAIAAYAGMEMASTEFEYFTPQDPANSPKILKKYLEIPTMQEDTRNITLAETTPGLSDSMLAGSRMTMWSQGFNLDSELMKRMSDHFFDVASSFRAVSPSITFQALSKPALQAMQKKGGNSLGLSPDDGPLFHALLYLSWTDPEDDKANMEAAKAYMDALVAMAKELGAANDYIYMPYASPYQRPIAGYGNTNMERLRKVAKKYDPAEVIQKLSPGYFKLDGKAPYGTVIS